MLDGGSGKSQIAVEFIVVYSFVLIVFVFFFSLIVTQRASTLNQQDYSYLQLVAQSISQSINQAVSGGSGYNTTLTISEPVGTSPYHVIITTTGLVIVNQSLGSQVLSAVSSSGARNLVVNGTVLPGSANGITLYSVPAYTGSISFYNQGGTIFVDEQPPSLAGLLGKITFGAPKVTKFAFFNGTSYVYGTLQGNAPIDYASGFTLTAWVYDANQITTDNMVLYSEGNSILGPAFQVTLGQNYGIGVNVINTYNAYVYFANPPTNAPMGPWVFVAVSCTSCAYQTGNYNFYLDNLSQTNVGIQGENAIGVNEIGVGVSTGTIYTGFANSLVANTGIANLQIYSTTLTTNQIIALYKEGITGSPIGGTNLALWYKLAGDTLDYSGSGDHAGSYLANFQTVAQLPVLGSTFYAGTDLAPYTKYLAGAYSTAGFLSSISIYNPTSNTVPTNGYSASDPNAITFSFNNDTIGDPQNQATIFLNSNGAHSSIAVTAVGYNGNLTLIGNLIGWWPMNEGTGNTIHDLGGQYDMGTGNNIVWNQTINSTSFTPAYFPGISSSSGYASIDQIASYNVLTINDTFTAVAWINSGSQSATYSPAAVTQVNFASGTVGSGALPTYNEILTIPNNAQTAGSFYFAVGGTEGNTTSAGETSPTFHTYAPGNLISIQTGSYLIPVGHITEYYANFTTVGNSISNTLTYNMVTRYQSTEISMAGMASSFIAANIIGFASNGLANTGHTGTFDNVLSFTVPAAGDQAVIVGSAVAGEGGVFPTLPTGCTQIQSTTPAAPASYVDENGGSAAWVSNCIFTSGGTYTANWLTDAGTHGQSMAVWVFNSPTYGPSATGEQGVLGDGGNDQTGLAGGFTVMADDPNECNILYINTVPVKFPGSTCGLTPGNWVMLTAEYNGQSGVAAVYLNKTIFTSNILASTLDIAGDYNIIIGSDPWAQGSSVFNGPITNVQLYSTALNQSQINYLYSQGATGSPIDDAGLVGWWPLDGSGVDYSYNNNPASVGSGVAFTPLSYGKYTVTNPGYSPVFSPSTGAYVQISNVNTLKLSTTTFGGWVKFTGPSYATGNFEWLMAKQNAYGIGACGNSINPCFYNWNTGATVQSTNTLQENQWYMLMATVSGTTENVYVDGIQELSGTVGIVSQNTKGWQIGYGNSLTTSGSQYLNGSALDIQVYNTVLSQSQIEQLYIAGLPPSSRLNIPT